MIKRRTKAYFIEARVYLLNQLYFNFITTCGYIKYFLAQVTTTESYELKAKE